MAALDLLGQVIDRAAIVIAGLVNLMRHHALSEQSIERLNRRRGQMAGGVHGAGKEAGIEQVQDRMLHPADILIDIHPIADLGGIGRRGGARRGEAGEIPRRIDERIHRVGFPPRLGPTLGAGAVAPGRVAVEWIARNVERHIIGQNHRQIGLGLRHHAAGRAMHHRDRAAPIALPR